MERHEITRFMEKYGGHRPCDRRTLKVTFVLDLDTWIGPKSGSMTLELPEEWLEEVTEKQAETFMTKVSGGFELVVAGAVRMVYAEEVWDILRAAEEFGRRYLVRKCERLEEDD